MIMGAPLDTPPTLNVNTVFRAPDRHSAIQQVKFVPTSPHPLAKPLAPGENIIEWRFDHAWKCDGVWLRSSAFHLFKYSGKKATLRLTVDVICSVEHHKHCPTLGDNDCNARIAIVKPDGSKMTFYNSEHESGGALFLIHRRGNYKKKVSSLPVIEFEITEGAYALSLDFKSWIGNRTFFESYEGWNIDSLRFEFNGLYIAWI
jgi:hypothetical protein